MALINTDWQKELKQVEDKITTVLDEKVEPLLDRTVAKASTEMANQIAKAEFELQDTANKFFIELTEQRQQFLSDMKAIIRYAAAAIFLVVVASVVVIKYLIAL